MSKWEGWILGFLHFGSSFCLRWAPALVFLVPPLPFLSVFLCFDLFLSTYFYRASLSAPHRVSALSHSLFLCGYFPAGFAHTFSPFPHLCPSHLLCSLSFPFPSPSFLFFSSLFLFFLYGKSKVINYEIIPWFEDTHDLLSRLLSWSGCTKQDDEMMKFLHYLIFIKQHDLTCFSFEILFYLRKEIFMHASWVSFLLVSSFPFSSFIFLWELILMI